MPVVLGWPGIHRWYQSTEQSADDQNPIDTDGDGIPDSIENLTGTDWRDPDTDGGGMIDGEECPPPLWVFNCIGGNFDPWIHPNDVIQNEIVFYANNSTFGVDETLDRYWRVHTYDAYTGAAYGKNVSNQIWTTHASRIHQRTVDCEQHVPKFDRKLVH